MEWNERGNKKNKKNVLPKSVEKWWSRVKFSQETGGEADIISRVEEEEEEEEEEVIASKILLFLSLLTKERIVWYKIQIYNKKTLGRK